jgi:SCP-2 sterol transfer family
VKAAVVQRVARLDRRPVTHKLILKAIPRAIGMRFDPASAVGLDATFELRIRDPGGGAPTPFALRISDGRLEAEPGPAVSPGAVATTGAGELIRLVSGSVGWPHLLASGRLELSGDPFLALRFPSLFQLPVSDGRRERSLAPAPHPGTPRTEPRGAGS